MAGDLYPDNQPLLNDQRLVEVVAKAPPHRPTRRLGFAIASSIAIAVGGLAAVTEKSGAAYADGGTGPSGATGPTITDSAGLPQLFYDNPQDWWVTNCQGAVDGFLGKNHTFIGSEQAIGRLGSRTVQVTMSLDRTALNYDPGEPNVLVYCAALVDNTVQLQLAETRNGRPSKRPIKPKNLVRLGSVSQPVWGNESVTFDGNATTLESVGRQVALQLPRLLTRQAFKDGVWVVNTITSAEKGNITTYLPGIPTRYDTVITRVKLAPQTPSS
jgi:hypothetical protein